MARYVYECGHCQTSEERVYPIGTAQRVTRCDCGHVRRLVIGAGVNLSATATPNKHSEVVSRSLMEQRWDRDMPAYKRMRDRGLQPPTIDGSAALENHAGDQLDIDFAPAIEAARGDGGRERVMDTLASVDEWGKRAVDA